MIYSYSASTAKNKAIRDKKEHSEGLRRKERRKRERGRERGNGKKNVAQEGIIFCFYFVTMSFFPRRIDTKHFSPTFLSSLQGFHLFNLKLWTWQNNRSRFAFRLSLSLSLYIYIYIYIYLNLRSWIRSQEKHKVVITREKSKWIHKIRGSAEKFISWPRSSSILI